MASFLPNSFLKAFMLRLCNYEQNYTVLLIKLFIKPSIMKKNLRNLCLRFMSFILFTWCNIAAFAQDKGVDVDVSLKKESEWYTNPIVWVIGGAVFILLLVALLRGGEKKSA